MRATPAVRAGHAHGVRVVWPPTRAGMLENAGDCLGIRDFANHTEFPAAFRTHTQIDTEHPVEPGHPGHGRRGRYARVLALLGADGRGVPEHDEVTVSGVAPYGHTGANRTYRPYNDTKVPPAVDLCQGRWWTKSTAAASAESSTVDTHSIPRGSAQYWTPTRSWIVTKHALVNAPDGLRLEFFTKMT